MEIRSDAALVTQVIAGDAEAFALLLRRYRDAHLRFATRMLGNRDDADEALQSAFLRAFRSLAKCTEPERFGAWFYRIVVNECRTLAARRAHRERSLVRDPATLGSLAERNDPVGNDALRGEIQHALDGLPPEHREAFLLKHVEELSYEEMAEVTGAGISALKMRVKRACQRLQGLLEEAYHD